MGPRLGLYEVAAVLVGFAAMGMGMDAVHWGQVAQIVTSGIASPVLAGALSLVLFVSIQRLVLGREEPLAAARRWCPWWSPPAPWRSRTAPTT